MAKEDENKKNKLAVVAPLAGILAVIGTPPPADGETVANIKGTEKLNLPPLLKPKTIPVGATISGVMVKVVENFTGKDSLRGTKTLHLRHKDSGTEFLFPITRGMTSATKNLLDDSTKSKLNKECEGKTIYFTRTPDTFSQAHPDKAQFNFDIRIES